MIWSANALTGTVSVDQAEHLASVLNQNKYELLFQLGSQQSPSLLLNSTHSVVL
jgi:hypothetical protein